MLVIANNGGFTRPEKIIIYREIIKLIIGKPLIIKGLGEKIWEIIDNFRSRPGEPKREWFAFRV